jgi:hypothetical protein
MQILKKGLQLFTVDPALPLTVLALYRDIPPKIAHL